MAPELPTGIAVKEEPARSGALPWVPWLGLSQSAANGKIIKSERAKNQSKPKPKPQPMGPTETLAISQTKNLDS